MKFAVDFEGSYKNRGLVGLCATLHDHDFFFIIARVASHFFSFYYSDFTCLEFFGSAVCCLLVGVHRAGRA